MVGQEVCHSSPGSTNHIMIIMDSYIYYDSFLTNGSKDLEEGMLLEFTQGCHLALLQPEWQLSALMIMV